MMKSTLGIGLALALVLLPALPAGAARKYCETQVHERLDRLDVAPSDIHDIFKRPNATQAGTAIG